MVFNKKKPLKKKSLANWQEEEKLQCSFEEAIRDIHQNELFGASIQTLIKVNLTKNFGLDIENQSTKPISFIGFIGSISATRNTNTIKFIGNIRPTKSFLVLEDITQQLLETKYTLILGKLFKIVLDLRQYVMTNLAPKRRIVTALRPNLVITSMMIDLHMVVIQVHVGKNMVEDVLLDGRCCVNIMMEELWK